MINMHLIVFVNNMNILFITTAVKTDVTSVKRALSGLQYLSRVIWLLLQSCYCRPQPFRANLGHSHKTVMVNHYIISCCLKQLHLEAAKYTRDCEIQFSVCQAI